MSERIRLPNRAERNFDLEGSGPQIHLHRLALS